MSFEYRYYQRDCLDAVKRALADGCQRQLAVLAPGTGKTRIFAGLPEELGLGRFDVTLCAAHVDELCEQAEKAFAQYGSWIEKEKANKRASPMSRIIVGSVQTLQGKRLTEFFERFKGRIKVLVIDEAHRSVASSYRKLIAAFFEACPDGLLIGFTATPRRGDKRALGAVYERTVYHYGLADAIRDGFLVAPRAYKASTKVDLSKVKHKGDDFDPEALTAAIDTPGRTQIIVNAFREIIGHRQAIGFGASVAHAQKLAKAIDESGSPARAAWGAMGAAERADAMARFRAGTLQVLTCNNLFIEGLDVPGVEAAILARPTESPSVFEQSACRPLRPHESIAGKLGPNTTREERLRLIANSPKPYAIILDVADVTESHTLMSVPTLFGLPPKMDLRGRDPLLVRKKYEEARQYNAAKADAATDYEQLEAIVEVDLFTPPKLPDDVAKATSLDWRQSIPGVIRLRIPPMTMAKTKSGQEIPNYYARLRDLIETGKRAKLGDPVHAAYEELDVDLGSVRTVEASIDVVEDGLGQFQVWHERNGRRSLLGAVARRGEAVSRAETWVRKAYGNQVSSADRNAKWRRLPVKDGQKQALRKFGVPDDQIPKTRGDASLLMEALIARSRSSARRKAS